MNSKTPLKTKVGRVIILLVSLAIGIAIIVFSISRIQPPARLAVVESQRSVQVMRLEAVPFTIEARGFGTAEPSQTFSAVSNVKGRVIYRHADLESGAILSAGTLLAEIDPTSYQLGMREAQAEIASVEAEIAQLKQEKINSQELLRLEQQRLELSETSLERTRSLVSSGSVPQASLDTQMRATLAQRQAVQNLINQQNIVPIQLHRLDAQKERVAARLAQVRNDLGETKIFAPFDMRISEVNIEEFQYVNPGQILFSGDDIEFGEVVLQVPLQQLRRLLNEFDSGANENGEMNLSGIKAWVQMVGDRQLWQAEIVRIANGIDPATRTVQVVLRIEQPARGDDFGTNPPLPKGLFVQGVLQTQMKQNQLVLPQSGVHQDWVYLVTEENRLERRQVETAFRQNDMVVISSGLEGGETVILDDVVPAISGMLLSPVFVERVGQPEAGEAQ